MASNWEFAIAQARGEYVLVVGDDDGLLPYALREIDTLLKRFPTPALRWDAAYYTWPTFTIPGQENFLRVPFGRGVREVDSMQAIRSVIEFRELYTLLPMLYNSAIHRDVLAAMRAKAGRVIAHAIPDVYSGFAAAAVVGRYVSTDAPMSVSGQSKKSNGIATLFQRGRSPIDQEFRDLNARAGLLPHPQVPDLPVFPHVPVADAFLFARQCFFPDSDIHLNRRHLVEGCIANLRISSESEWQWAIGLLRESLQDDPKTRAWFEETLAQTPFRILPAQLRPEFLGLDGEFLHLDASGFGVTDVAGAAQLCENILNYRRQGITYLTGDLANMKGVTREMLALREYIKVLERGGRLKRAGRWVKHTILGAIDAFRKSAKRLGKFNPLHPPYARSPRA